MPKTTVIVSTYNRRKFLDACLYSILRTTKQEEVSILVLDDCSTDGTKEFMDALEKQFPNIRYRRFMTNNGLRYILDYGLRCAFEDNPDYISYIQDDVVMQPGWLDACIDSWELQKHVENSEREADLIPFSIGFITCHEAPEHPTITEGTILNRKVKFKKSIRATHLFASTERWKLFGPIPDLTPGIAAPKMGQGSKVDWWLMGHDEYLQSDNSLRKRGEKCLVIPGLACHMASDGRFSTWGNPNPEVWKYVQK